VFLSDINADLTDKYKGYIAFGFTLTGHDDLEPNASANAERIEAMRKLHEVGFKTWASIEPIIDVTSSFNMIRATKDFCDLYKVGLESGKKYDILDLQGFFLDNIRYMGSYSKAKFYFKDSFLKAINIDRSGLPSNCVTRDYKMFDYEKTM
jgi:hypothetical protein